MSWSCPPANAHGRNTRCVPVGKTSLRRLVQSRALCAIFCPMWGVCVINWGTGLQKGQMKQVYGLVCGIALAGRAEFAQLLLVSGSLLCRAAMVAALFLSPTCGHPWVPREQHLFSQNPSGETSQGALCPSGAEFSFHVVRCFLS